MTKQCLVQKELESYRQFYFSLDIFFVQKKLWPNNFLQTCFVLDFNSLHETISGSSLRKSIMASYGASAQKYLIFFQNCGRFQLKIWLLFYSHFCLPWCFFLRSKRSLKLSVSNVTQVGKAPEKKSTLSQFLHHKISVLTKFERKKWTIGVYSLNLVVATRARTFHN